MRPIITNAGQEEKKQALHIHPGAVWKSSVDGRNTPAAKSPLARLAYHGLEARALYDPTSEGAS